MPTIDADNWYYIIREFYAAKYKEDKDDQGHVKVILDKVEVRYMAIARKGSGFGTGVFGSGNMGLEVEWYNTVTEETKPFSTRNGASGVSKVVADAYLGKSG